MPTNDFYNPSGVPQTGSQGASGVMRQEFENVAAGFAKMPPLTGNGSRAVVVNAGGTGLTVTTGTLALAGNLATTGAFNTTLAQGANVTLTLPLVNGTLATLAGSEALTNKTYNGLTITTSTGTFTVTNGKTLTVANTLSFSGTDGSSVNFGAGGTVLYSGGAYVTSVGQTFTGGLISVAGSPITGSGTLALTVAGTSGGIPYFNSSTSWASSGALAANALMIGGGAGSAPTTTTTGTGVLTALGVNVGSAGAFVVNGGALGTPASGTLTNCTGLPIASGVSGLGTGVATALAVNTGTDGAFVVRAGALGTPASGTLTNCTGLPVASGISGLGTGVATALAVNTGSAGAVVLFNGALGTPSSGTATNLTGTASGLTAGTATNLAGGAAASIPYQTGAGATAFITPTGNVGSFLRSVGAAAPTWTSYVFPSAPGDAGNFMMSDGTNWTSVAPSRYRMFSAINGSNQSISTATLTEVNYTEVYDTHNAFGSNTYTVPTGFGGWHRFITVTSFNGTSLTAESSAFYVNGSIATKGWRWLTLDVSGSVSMVHIFDINLAVGDAVTVRARLDGTSPLIEGSSNFNSSFSCDWLRAA